MNPDTKIYLHVEKLKIKREKSRLVLEKSISLYFIFMLIGVLGFTFNFIDSYMLNTMILIGIIILIFGTIPYIIAVHTEEKIIDSFLK